MGPEHFGWGSWCIFPIGMPLVMIVVLAIVLYLVFGRGSFRPPCWSNSDRFSNQAKDIETPMEILKARFAKGEITREEFAQIRKDLQD